MGIKISEFIIGMIFVSFIIAVFGFFMAEMNTNYGVSYDETNVAAYNQLNELSDLSEEIKEEEIEEKTGTLDIIGNYFTGAYKVLRITAKSVDTFDNMSNTAIDQSMGGNEAVGNLLRTAVMTSIIVLVFLGVIISAIVKRDL